jgi:hypothetical protein
MPPGERSKPTSDPTRAGARADPCMERERFGPVAIDRHRKDDGRSLIMYTRVDERGKPPSKAS